MVQIVSLQLTVSLGLAVLYCSTLIHIYSVDYLSTDPHNQRFFSYISAFTAGMLVLICGGNFYVMFVGWEAIGAGEQPGVHIISPITGAHFIAPVEASRKRSIRRDVLDDSVHPNSYISHHFNL